MRVKICGLRRKEDISIVNRYSPNYAGFIIEYPKSKRSLTLGRAIELEKELSDNIKSVGVFVNAPVSRVVEAAKYFDLLQLHGNEDNDYIWELASAVDNPIMKAFVINNEYDIERAEECSAQLLLLDGGMGNGKAFDWSLIHRINKPFFLAGGLNEDNIRLAIESVRPMGIDISSGVETDGFKDEKKIKRIMEIIDEYR